MNDPGLHVIPWLVASFVLAFAVTAAAIGYARRRNVVDQPGRRRSHTVPTPRGGGIGIVLAVLAGLLVFQFTGVAPTLRLALAVGLVALIGWIDDHRPLGALPRLAVQFTAAGIWLWPLIGVVFGRDADDHLVFSGAALMVALLLVLLVVWSINLHNFMDGIDGLLALQALFVLGALALLCAREEHSTHDAQLGMWTAAVAGFVPFNFPRARIFMGDVGSGVLGLLIAAAVVWQMSLPQTAAASGLIAASAFLTDASCTLLSRIFAGRRWYSAHREHLYQWLTRCGWSHARVVAVYMIWNFGLVAPVLWWVNREPVRYRVTELDPAWGWALGVYAVAIALWIGGKRWCRRHAAQRPPAPAAGNGAEHASA